MKDNNICKFGSEFIAIEMSNLPSNSDSIKRAIVGEAFRLALDSIPDPQISMRKMHIHSLRKWVIQKLRGIMPEIEDKDYYLFSDVLKDSKESNLLFIGDILELSKGYYSPAPTRVVNIDKSNWILVSGLPTYYFKEVGLNVSVTGVGRVIKDTELSKIKEFDIPVQSKESYVNLIKYDKNFLLDLVNVETGQIWRHERNWQGYQAWVKKWWRTSDKGFLWSEGGTPTKIRTELGLISFWREKREYNFYEYWLRIKTEEREFMISVPSLLYKHICLIFDELGGEERVAKFKKLDEDYAISIDFSPPKSQVRWLHAIGAKFEGFDNNKGEFRWIIPSSALEQTAEVFETISKISIQNI